MGLTLIVQILIVENVMNVFIQQLSDNIIIRLIDHGSHAILEYHQNTKFYYLFKKLQQRK